MSSRPIHALGVVVAACVAGALAGCAASRGKPAPPVMAAGSGGGMAAAQSPAHDGWQVLIPAPFGSTLEQIPFPLHEVILFHDEQRDAADTGEGRTPEDSEAHECYAKSGAAFTFAGAAAEDYVLCFAHGRLARVEAALLPPQGESADLFVRWCGDWLRGISVIQQSATVCEGRDGAAAFSARLNEGDADDGRSITLNVFDAVLR